jgi:hypothetical protein
MGIRALARTPVITDYLAPVAALGNHVPHRTQLLEQARNHLMNIPARHQKVVAGYWAELAADFAPDAYPEFAPLVAAYAGTPAARIIAGVQAAFQRWGYMFPASVYKASFAFIKADGSIAKTQVGIEVDRIAEDDITDAAVHALVLNTPAKRAFDLATGQHGWTLQHECCCGLWPDDDVPVEDPARPFVGFTADVAARLGVGWVYTRASQHLVGYARC